MSFIFTEQIQLQVKHDMAKLFADGKNWNTVQEKLVKKYKGITKNHLKRARADMNRLFAVDLAEARRTIALLAIDRELEHRQMAKDTFNKADAPRDKASLLQRMQAASIELNKLTSAYDMQEYTPEPGTENVDVAELNRKLSEIRDVSKDDSEDE